MHKNTKYEVLTPSGFQDFDGIQQIVKTEYLYILFDNMQEIKCSTQHLFQINDGSFVNAIDLNKGSLVKSIHGYQKIENIRIITECIDLYDLVNVSNGSLYYTDDVVSHNCDVDFLTSGATVVDPEILTYYEKEIVADPIQKRGESGDLWIWKFPDFSKTYILSADVARGDGNDYSAFHVIDIDTLEQVAEYEGKIGVLEYGRMLVAAATEYNNALLVIENTGIGLSVVQEAINLRYTNLFYSYKTDGYFDEAVHLAKNYDLKPTKDKTAGFVTSHTTRPIIVSKIETYCRERIPIIKSKRMVESLRTFIWVNGRGQAAKGYNDDLVMAFGFTLFLRDTALRLKQAGIEITKKSIENIHKTVYTPKTNFNSPWEYRNSRGEINSLKWLL